MDKNITNNEPVSKTTQIADKSISVKSLSVKSKGRRAALAKAGFAGTAVAGGLWTKPIVNSLVLPAHAQTTVNGPVAISMTGPSSNQDPVVSNHKQKGEASLLARALDTVVSPAVAAAERPMVHGHTISLGARFANNSTFLLCVSLDFPEGNMPSGPVNVTVNGPEIYFYNYGGYSGIPGPLGPRLDYQLSGSTSTNLEGPEGRDFDVTFDVPSLNSDGLRVVGCVTDADFSSANGYMHVTNSVGRNSDNTFEQAGYGGAFSVASGAPCTVGSGNGPSSN